MSVEIKEYTMKDYTVVQTVDKETLKSFILDKHYAQRMPSISYSFGLYKDDVCLGVCTFGKPASNSLCVGVADVIHVCVAKCSAWSPIPINMRKTNQNITLFHNGNKNSETNTTAPPSTIIGL